IAQHRGVDDIMKARFATIAAIAFLFAGCSRVNTRPEVRGAPPGPGAAADNTPVDTSDMAKKLFDAVNDTRKKNGLTTLAWSEELSKSAAAHSNKMSSNSFLGTRGADEPAVFERILSGGIKTEGVAENVLRIRVKPEKFADESV